MFTRPPTALRSVFGTLLLLGMPYLVFGQATPSADVALFTLRVPRDAKVEVAGEETTSTGTERSFVTPSLEIGRRYSYRVVATWTEKGKARRVERQIRFKAG